jgi:phosphate transport system substrate-binding protein
VWDEQQRLQLQFELRRLEQRHLRRQLVVEQRLRVLVAHGSTAQTNAIQQWIKDYQNACSNANITYDADGSGSGFTAFTSKQADFAGSDYALASNQIAPADAACAPGKAVNIPLVPGSIAVMYNVPNVPASTHLKLTASVLAKIFNGSITTWNDQAIASLNPGVNLPSTAIQTFHRSDGSGTSYNFSNYLNHLAPSDWTQPANKQWPANTGQGVKGSSLIAQKVKSTPGGIGYAEYSYAVKNNLSTAAISNKAGQFVPISQDAAAKFIAQATVQTTAAGAVMNFNYDYSAPDAYPNVLVTYEFACSQGTSAKAKEIKDFLTYAASSTAQGELVGLGYVPLPSAIATQVQQAISALSAS